MILLELIVAKLVTNNTLNSLLNMMYFGLYLFSCKLFSATLINHVSASTSRSSGQFNALDTEFEHWRSHTMEAVVDTGRVTTTPVIEDTRNTQQSTQQQPQGITPLTLPSSEQLPSESTQPPAVPTASSSSCLYYISNEVF